MAGAGYKLFNTGDVLTAQQVNEYLMQQTVMVFANAAARTTALSGILAEGLVSYLKDTDVVEIYTGAAWVSLDDPNAIQNSIVDAKGDLITATADNTPARLAVGTNGQVLTADSTQSTGLAWATSTSGGMTLISTTTLSGASVVLSSIPGTYNNLFLLVRSFQPATDGADLKMRYNADTNTRYTNPDLGVGISNRTFGGTSLSVSAAQDNGTTNAISAITIFDYTNTATWKYSTAFSVGNNATTTTNSDLVSVHGLYNQTGAITSITLFPSSGNFTAGTALLYGVK